MKKSCFEKIILASSSHDIRDDMIYHRYAKTLSKSNAEITVIGQGKSEQSEDGLHEYCLPNTSSRFDRFVKYPIIIEQFIKRFNASETVVFIFTPDLIRVAKRLGKHGYSIVQVFVEDYASKIACKKWIPELLKKPITKRLRSEQCKLGQKCWRNIFVDSNTLSKYENNVKKTILLPNYPITYNDCNTKYSQREFGKHIRLVYAGGLCDERGLGVLEEIALRKGKEVELHLFGKATNSYDLDRVLQLSKLDGVYYHGAVDYTEILQRMPNFDVGLAFYERNESYRYICENTTKIFEYMEFGLPVAAEDLPLLKRIIEVEDHAGKCFNTSKNNWIDDFMKFLGDSLGLEEMSAAGVHSFQSKRRWEIYEQELIETVSIYV